VTGREHPDVFDVLTVGPMRASFINDVISWVDDRTTHFYWTGNTMRWPPNAHEFAAHTGMIRASRTSSAFILNDQPSREPVGYFEIGSVDEANGFARLERFLIDPQLRGHGLGQRALHRIKDQFFADRRVYRLELVVATENHAAIACYQKAGFTIEGTLREARNFDGQRKSLHIMGLLRGEWDELSSTQQSNQDRQSR
jgi:RimJ/RimL family protein N-acetyltransferase